MSPFPPLNSESTASSHRGPRGASRTPYIWLAFFCLQLALLAGSMSFNSVRMAVTYGRPPLPTSYGADLQRQAWEAFLSRDASRGESMVGILSTRILVPASLAALTSLTGASWEQAFSLFRLVSMLAAYVIFFVFLLWLFRPLLAILGTVFVAATVPLTFNAPYEVPTDFPELAMFSAAMLFLLAGRDGLFCSLVFVATLNRETACFLPLFLLFSRWEWPLKPRTVALVVVAGLAWLVPFSFMRYAWMSLGWPNHSSSLSHNIPGLLRFAENLNPFNNYLFYFYLLGVAYVLPVMYWSSLPSEFRRLVAATPLVLAVYLLGGGFMNEPREIVVLYPVLVPASIYALGRLLQEPVSREIAIGSGSPLAENGAGATPPSQSQA